MSIKDGGKKSKYYKPKANVQMSDNFSISKIQNESNMQIEEENVIY